MNDFTKEELQLFEWYMRKEKITPKIPYIHLNLIRKLQLMIDNYCEHEWINATYCEKCNQGILENSFLPIGRECIEASTEPA